ncbi:ComEA family DNA-binding protein [Agromyces albus]|uniref:ComEA family DNA-binding protein n=1 Tax=Agromyces albus TaxID=205332 RepID=A0A4Q2L1K2_9MICO|nr:ComEA family DNA-binding protein [Agromyces albus]RXZ71257.1 ComEA family DNA-binding protein [Agromyces albus]
MPASPDPQLLDALDPVARRAGPRVRIAVGAAVVLFVVAVAVAAMLSFAASGGGGQERIDAVEVEATDAAGHHASVEEVATTPLLVHVLGAVAKPGLVELAAGSRVVDAVAAAGGFTAEADPAGVNLARPVVDGEQLVVLAIGQVPPPGPAAGSGADSSGSATSGDGVVHLNTADVAALDTLPRIGPALAQRIIDWRDANGPFTSVEQLLEVTGIGDAVFAGLVDRVSL